MTSYFGLGILYTFHHAFPNNSFYHKRLIRRLCLAGGPKEISCGKSKKPPNMLIHHFPNRIKDTAQHMQWVCSVCWHRPNWFPTSDKESPSSIRFEDSTLKAKRDIAASLLIKVKLETDAIPSIEEANNHEEINTLPHRDEGKARDQGKLHPTSISFHI